MSTDPALFTTSKRPPSAGSRNHCGVGPTVTVVTPDPDETVTGLSRTAAMRSSTDVRGSASSGTGAHRLAFGIDHRNCGSPATEWSVSAQ